MVKVERAIVTLRFPFHEEEMDIEMPVFLPVEEICEKVLELLICQQPHRYGGIADVDLFWNGKKLDKQTNLAEHGIWDGSILDIALKK